MSRIEMLKVEKMRNNEHWFDTFSIYFNAISNTEQYN